MKKLQRPDATIHYIREGTGTPLVLVQGAGVIGEGWRPQIDALRASHAIVALDNRGIGGSNVASPGGVGRQHAANKP